MVKTITILADFHASQVGSLVPVTLPKGTTLLPRRIVNNGTAALAYECEFEGRIIYVKPLVNFVQPG